jgi:multidrug efflux pump subunit AcrA (membrane-fusion protein)
VRITSDALPGRTVSGKITAINPQADSATRNVRVQATATNKEERLHPGMFATVAVVLPGKNQVLTIPATAVLPAPYGDSVFVVEEQKIKTGQAAWRCASSLSASGNGAAISSPLSRALRQRPPWSAPGCSSCATASPWWWTTD